MEVTPSADGQEATLLESLQFSCDRTFNQREALLGPSVIVERGASTKARTMNWEATAAVANVVAAIGVIASLLYLAAQVRHENRASTVAAKLASTQLLSNFVDLMITNPELMDLWLKGRKSLECLSKVEKYRFANMCLKAFWFFSVALFQLQKGTLNKEDWTEFHPVIQFWLEGKGVQEWWQGTRRTRFGEGLILFIDREITGLTGASAH
jgi:hypothetical protein